MNSAYSALYYKVGWQPGVAYIQSQIQNRWFFPPLRATDARDVLAGSRTICDAVDRAIHAATEDAFRRP